MNENIEYKGTLLRLEPDAHGFVNLTLLWNAEGRPENRDPKYWLRSKTAQRFIEHLAEKRKVTKNHLLNIAPGKSGFTKAHWQIALAYAKYLSPQLHELVNEVFKERVEEELNPELAYYRGRERAVRGYRRRGWSDEEIAERLDEIQERHKFTATLKQHGVEGNGYGICTNGIYEPILGKNAEAKKAQLALKKHERLRDHLPRVERAAIKFAETLASDSIEKEKAHGTSECYVRCSVEARSVARLLELRQRGQK